MPKKKSEKPQPKPVKKKSATPKDALAISIEAYRMRRILGAALTMIRGALTPIKMQAIHFRQTKTRLEVVSTNGHWMFVWNEERRGEQALLTISSKAAEQVLHMAIHQDEDRPIILRPRSGSDAVCDCDMGRLYTPHHIESDSIFNGWPKGKYAHIIDLGQQDRGPRDRIGMSAHYLERIAGSMTLAADDNGSSTVDLKFLLGTGPESVAVVKSDRVPHATIYLMPMRLSEDKD